MIDLLDMNKHLERLAKHFSTCLAIPMPSCSNATGNFYELTRLTGYFVFVLRSMGWLVKSEINALIPLDLLVSYRYSSDEGQSPFR